jgi:hypothetical protein
MTHLRPADRRLQTPALGLVALVSFGHLLSACSVGSTVTPSSPTPAATATNQQVNEADNGHTVTVPVGSEVTVQLGNTYWNIQPSSDPAMTARVYAHVIPAAQRLAVGVLPSLGSQNGSRLA